MTYSFESPKVYDKLLLPQDSPLRKAVVISNPLGEDFSIMRTWKYLPAKTGTGNRAAGRTHAVYTWYVRRG